MRVLMLGWEFPPFIAGGLGTACQGLTRALTGLGVDVLFVLPRPVGAAGGGGDVRGVPVSLAGAQYGFAEGGGTKNGGGREANGRDAVGRARAEAIAGAARPRGAEKAAGASEVAKAAEGAQGASIEGAQHQVSFRVVDSVLTPYMNEADYQRAARERGQRGGVVGDGRREQESQKYVASAPSVPYLQSISPPQVSAAPRSFLAPPAKNGGQYAGDLISETQRYANLALAVARGEKFDVIHAHDWMTFRAGLAVAKASGKPLVVHVHSTEYDRAGQNLNPQIVEIEKAGMMGADRVIAVSHMTRRLLIARYGVAQEKVEVVHNAVEAPAAPAGAGIPATIKPDEKIVLFLGRVTYQKGPEYFLSAARKVLNVYEKVKFVIAGSGDLMPSMVEMAAQMGIGHKVLFTGFLRSQEVERILRMASVYVMPSVSEPFGIAPLEALAQDVPVIISKQSGVSEVLEHVLKVDFWNTEELADKIVAVLKHPPLSQAMRKHGQKELRKITWRDAAQHVGEIYAAVTGGAGVAV